MADFERGIIGQMERGYIAAVIEMERAESGGPEWEELSVGDVDSKTLDLVQDDCCLFAGISTAATHATFEYLIEKIGLYNFGFDFYLSRSRHSFAFTNAYDADIGPYLDDLAMRFPRVEFETVDGRIWQMAPTRWADTTDPLGALTLPFIRKHTGYVSR